jgi:hypothetical protein
MVINNQERCEGRVTGIMILCLLLTTLLAGGCDDAGSTPVGIDTKTPIADIYAPGDFSALDPDQSKPKCSGLFRIEDLEGNLVEAPDGDGDFVFDIAQLREFDVEMTTADWAWLQANALAEEYVPANVVIEGHRYIGVGIRFKGAWSSLVGCFDDEGNQTCPKLSMKIRFDKYDSCGRFHGLRRLVFNSGLSDVTMMRDTLMYGLWNYAGFHAPRATHAMLRVNGEPWSVYVLVEPIDKEFIQARFDEDGGNLYKEAWPNHDDEWEYSLSLRTNESTGDISRILAFSQAVQHSDDTQFEAEVGQFTDLSRIARILAVGRVISDEDGITRFWCFDTFGDCANHNYYWYDEPGVGFHLIPWDMDVTFYGYQEPEKFALSWWAEPDHCGPVPKWVVEDPDDPDLEDDSLVFPPQCDRLMHQAVHHHTDAYNQLLADMIPALQQAEVDLESFRLKLEERLLADPKYPHDLAKFTNSVDWFKKKIGQQIAALEEHLATL